MKSNMKKVKFTKESFVVLKRLMSTVFRKYKFSFCAVFISIILSSLAMVSMSLSLKYILDDYIIPLIGKVSPNFSSLYKALFVLAIIFLVGIISNFIYTRLTIVIGHGTLKDIRDEMFIHMQKLPIKYFDDRKTGDIMSIYTNDTDNLKQMVAQTLPQLFMQVIIIIFNVISMLILSPILTLIAFITLISLFIITKKVGTNSSKYFGERQKNLAEVSSFGEELINGQRVVKVFNHEDISKKEFDILNEKLFLSTSKANTYANILAPIVVNIGNIQFVITAILGGLLFINNIGGVTIGVIVAYLQFTKSFSQPFMQIAQLVNTIAMSFAGAERIYELLDAEVEVDNGIVTLVNVYEKEGKLIETEDRSNLWAWKKVEGDKVTYIKLSGDIKFENMNFGYESSKLILENLNLEVENGMKIAFVGSTGAGKTTIMNLVNRFYDVTSGKILYDGINVNDIKKSDLRHSFGIVLQDTHLFTGTIMDNIRYGKLDATDDEVKNAAKLARADKFIEMLPDGYDTVLDSKGEELSVGQKQLLAIARAAIANPPVLILDEATSNIDTRTEKLVQAGMDNLMKGRTVFVIAHRLSTIKNSNKIVVLDKGKIIEVGTHKVLMALKGIYYKLYTGKLELS